MADKVRGVKEEREPLTQEELAQMTEKIRAGSCVKVVIHLGSPGQDLSVYGVFQGISEDGLGVMIETSGNPSERVVPVRPDIPALPSVVEICPAAEAAQIFHRKIAPYLGEDNHNVMASKILAAMAVASV